MPGVMHGGGGVIDSCGRAKTCRPSSRAAGRSRRSGCRGLFVRIGLNGPRISRRRVGLHVQQVSIWLGRAEIEDHDAGLLVVARLHRALRLQTPADAASVSPMAPSAPTWRKSRRVMPSQVCVEARPVKRSIRFSANQKRSGGAEEKRSKDSGRFTPLLLFSSTPPHLFYSFFKDSAVTIGLLIFQKLGRLSDIVPLPSLQNVYPILR